MDHDSKDAIGEVSRRSMLLHGIACATGIATASFLSTNAATSQQANKVNRNIPFSAKKVTRNAADC